MKKKGEEKKEDVVIKDVEGKEYKVRLHTCRMMICEDLDTGDIVTTYDGHCPSGYIEKIAGRISTRGMRFRPATKREIEDMDYIEKRRGDKSKEERDKRDKKEE